MFNFGGVPSRLTEKYIVDYFCLRRYLRLCYFFTFLKVLIYATLDGNVKIFYSCNYSRNGLHIFV